MLTTNESLQIAPRTALLEKRSARCVCKYCGSRLRIKSITFNSIIDGRSELYCSKCGRIEFGVEPEIYQSAKYYVDEFDYSCYPELDDTPATRQMSVAKVSELMNWLAERLGIVDDDGFCVPLRMDMSRMGECLHLTDAALDALKAGEGHD